LNFHPSHFKESAVYTPEINPYVVTNQARGDMIDHTASQVFVHDFDPVIADESPSRGGHNQGPSPLEYILVALCA
jgi:hypothetical protein